MSRVVDRFTCAVDAGIRAGVGVSCLASADHFVGGWIVRADSIGIASTVLHLARVCRRMEDEMR